jgi:hypothetical protein
MGTAVCAMGNANTSEIRARMFRDEVIPYILSRLFHLSITPSVVRDSMAEKFEGE